ncbi:MAG: GNAT family N-acetyltransferase [Spirochaetales bacterium]
MNLEVVSATPADLKSIMKLEHEGFVAGIRENAEVFLRRVEVFPNGFLLLKRDDAVVGYLSSEIWPYRDPFEPDWFLLGHDISTRHKADGDELYVSSMTILPEFRGQGMGSDLFRTALRQLEERYNGLHSCILLVNERWDHARRIYDSLEFRRIGTLKQFFQPQGLPASDGWICRRPLPLTNVST